MKELFKNTIIYSIARIIPGITGFILLPIYTSYLDPSEYGKVQSMQVLGAFLIIIFSLASERSIFRLYYDYDTDKKKKEFLGNVAMMVLTTTIIFGSLIFLLKDYVQLIFSSIEFYPYYFYIIIYAMLTSLSFIPLNLFQVKGKSVKFSIYSISGFIISTLLILYFVVYKLDGAKGILKGQFIAAGIMLLFYGYEIIKNATFKFKVSIIKNILSFSIPFIPVLISTWLLNMSNRVFLDYFIKEDTLALFEIGIYSFAYKIASVGGLAIGAIFTAYNPIFYKEASSDNQVLAIKKLEQIKYFYALIALLFCFLIAFVSRNIIILFFAKEYASSIYLIPVISLCFFFTQIVGLYNLMVYQEKKTKSVMVNLIISSLVTIGFNLLLIPIYFSMGAAIGTLIGVLCNVFLQYRSAQKSYYIDFKLIKIIYYLIALYGIVAIDIVFVSDDGYLSLILKCTLIIFIFLYIVINYNKGTFNFNKKK